MCVTMKTWLIVALLPERGGLGREAAAEDVLPSSSLLRSSDVMNQQHDPQKAAFVRRSCGDLRGEASLIANTHLR